MGFYFNDNGTLKKIAGKGVAEYGASTIRKGTINIPADHATGGIFIEFDTPLPDNDYIVSWEFDDCGDGDAAHIVGPHYKYATGFGLYYFGGFTKEVIIKWTAFKLYTDTEYNNLVNGNKIGEVTTDGTETYNAAFSRLYALVKNKFKLNKRYILTIDYLGTTLQFFYQERIMSNRVCFEQCYVHSTGGEFAFLHLMDSSAYFIINFNNQFVSTSGIETLGTTVPAAGYKFAVYEETL